jgi:SAM-dependent methyltransferase
MSPAYTHGHADSVLRSHRTRTAANSAGYLLPHLRAGQRLLDVGSGPGTITADLAALIAPGRVVALETSEEILDLTRGELAARQCDNVDFLVGDVHALDLPDDSFDVVHAHQVLQHVADPVQALREMVRVCRPGGVVAVRDGDYGAFTWFPASSRLDRWLALYSAAARANGGEPDAGRRLLSWAHAAGCEQVEATSSTWTYSHPAARAEWAYAWADRITVSAIADQLVNASLASRAELEEIAAGWREWAGEPDGWLSVLHGELLIHV